MVFYEESCEDGCEDPINHASEVSVVGSPLLTDDDRRGLPALYHQDQQGGNPESKHVEFEIVDEEFPIFLSDVIDRACANYVRFLGAPVELSISMRILF